MALPVSLAFCPPVFFQDVINKLDKVTLCSLIQLAIVALQDLVYECRDQSVRRAFLIKSKRALLFVLLLITTTIY